VSDFCSSDECSVTDYWSCSCGRQSVDQFVWVSGLPLGPLTRFYLALLFSADNYFILLPKASSLTRKRVCSLQCNHSLVRLLTPNNHTLPSHLRLCSLFVVSYDSRGLRWRYSNPPPHGVTDYCIHYRHFLLRCIYPMLGNDQGTSSFTITVT
jgi:hypothetical protein